MTLLNSLKINVLNAGIGRPKGQWIFRNLSSPYSKIYFVTGGEGHVALGKKEYKMTAGNMYLIPRFCLTEMYWFESFSYYFVHFLAEPSNGMDIFSILGWCTQVKAVEYEATKSLFERIIKLNPGRDLPTGNKPKLTFKKITDRSSRLDKQKSLRGLFETDGLMRLLIAMFLEDKNNKSFELARAEGFRRFGNVLEYIHNNPAGELSLSELSSKIGLHPTYFSNLFKKVMGVTPMQFINKKRIEKAQTLLLESQMELAEVSHKVGFDDVFYFSRVFRKIAGVPPSQYRKNQILA